VKIAAIDAGAGRTLTADGEPATAFRNSHVIPDDPVLRKIMLMPPAHDLLDQLSWFSGPHEWCRMSVPRRDMGSGSATTREHGSPPTKTKSSRSPARSSTSSTSAKRGSAPACPSRPARNFAPEGRWRGGQRFAAAWRTSPDIYRRRSNGDSSLSVLASTALRSGSSCGTAASSQATNREKPPHGH
jgi:hypothetical protein